MFCKKKKKNCLVYLTYNNIKKYTLTCISIKKYIHLPVLMTKKVNKKYTLTCINDEKGQ